MTHPPKYKLEYLTFPLEALHPPNDTTLAKNWRRPIPRHLLPHSLHNVSRTRSRYAPYRMKDLTIPRWIRLARKLAKRQPLWNKFVGFMYMGEDDDDVDVEDWREEDGDEDMDEDWDEDGLDENEQEVLQEGQWSLPTNLRKDEDDLLP